MRAGAVSWRRLTQRFSSRLLQAHAGAIAERRRAPRLSSSPHMRAVRIRAAKVLRQEGGRPRSVAWAVFFKAAVWLLRRWLVFWQQHAGAEDGAFWLAYIFPDRSSGSTRR